MMDSNINVYIHILHAITEDFVFRRYKEMYDETLDISIMKSMIIDYHDIITHVDINDTILSINTIILAERFDIPCQIVSDHHYEVLE